MKRSLMVFFALAVGGVRCRSSGPAEPSVENLGASLSITLIPSAVSVPPGRTVPVTVILSRLGNSTDPVTVNPSELPAGVSASPIEIVGNTGNLLLSASRSAPVTSHFPVAVTASSKGATAVATLTLSVSSSRFSLAVTPGSISVKRRSARTVTVTVSRENFPDVIEVTASGPPDSGLTADTLLLSGNRGNLVVRADLSAPLGQLSLTVSAVSGSIRETAPLQVTVDPLALVDESFGDGGQAITDLGGVRIGTVSPVYVTAQQDRQIVLAGTRRRQGPCPLGTCVGLAVARYSSDGRLDPSFLGPPDAGSPPGVAINFEVQASAFSPPTAVAVSDGGILVTSSAPADTLFGLTVDGNPDPAFNADGGRPAGRARQSINAIAVALVGEKILVAGTIPAPARFALARYKSNGTLDDTFGDGGVLVQPFAGLTTNPTVAAVLDSGKAKVVGNATIAGRSYLAVTSFDTGAGSIDRSFNDGGVLIQLGRGDGGTSQSKAAFDLDGHTVVLALVRDSSTSPTYYALASIQPDGMLDPNFGMGGVTRFFGLDGGATNLNAAALSPDHQKIVLVGNYRGNQFLVVRFNSNGLLDETFGNEPGMIVNEPARFGANNNVFTSVTFQGDAGIVAAGTVGSPTQFVVVRYLP